jgi:aminoglycoside phosphotransferase family enzyme
MRSDRGTTGHDKTGLEAKVAFLSDPKVYPTPPRHLARRETHMSWVFIGDRFVYKLKKPVRFSYLDFCTLERRAAACRAELRLNRRLAPQVYVDVVPLTLGDRGLAIRGAGRIVDHLVVMRRLDERQMLENAVIEGTLERVELDRLAAILASFYARARPSLTDPASFLADWRRKLAENRRVLADRALDLDFGTLAGIDRAQRRFLEDYAGFLIDRIARRKVVDGHGDLRPEHIWPGRPIAIIDCLEFSPTLRTVDPFDELAFLDIECRRLGAAWPGPYLARQVGRRLGDRISTPLLAFYRCYRAATRARLAFAHLLEPDGREPDKWPTQGKAYLAIALGEARAIERFLSKRRRRTMPPIRDAAPRSGRDWRRALPGKIRR